MYLVNHGTISDDDWEKRRLSPVPMNSVNYINMSKYSF